MSYQRHFRGIHKKNAKVPTWGAVITLPGEKKRYLDMWRDPNLVAVHHFGERAHLNCHSDRYITYLFTPTDIRFSTKEEEKEHRLAERQLALERHKDPLVHHYVPKGSCSDGVQLPVLRELRGRSVQGGLAWVGGRSLWGKPARVLLRLRDNNFYGGVDSMFFAQG
jgi:hypothetical protein